MMKPDVLFLHCYDSKETLLLSLMAEIAGGTLSCDATVAGNSPELSAVTRSGRVPSAPERLDVSVKSNEKCDVHVSF